MFAYSTWDLENARMLAALFVIITGTSWACFGWMSLRLLYNRLFPVKIGADTAMKKPAYWMPAAKEAVDDEVGRGILEFESAEAYTNAIELQAEEMARRYLKRSEDRYYDHLSAVDERRGVRRVTGWASVILTVPTLILIGNFIAGYIHIYGR